MNDQLGLFLKDVCEITGMDRTLPMNSGAEAVETAIKGMRKWGHEEKGLPEDKGEIIVANENFHGRTVTIISFSSEELYKKGFGPYTPGFKIVDFNDADALEEAITDETIGFLVEPMQGEAGIRIPDDGYLSDVEEICRDHDILLALDEIQTGLGRTGEMFAADHENVTPDLYILGKALSGGMYPVSAVAGRDDLMERFTPGTHGSTYGGSPLAAAVGRTALRVIQDENMVENASELGPYFRDGLRAMDADPVKEVRGKGLFIGVEIKEEYGEARPYAKKIIENGVLAKDTHGTVLRFAPPLIIKKDQIDEALRRIEPVLKNFRPE
jgi:ornithine--oxo-acid transaminase